MIRCLIITLLLMQCLVAKEVITLKDAKSTINLTPYAYYVADDTCLATAEEIAMRTDFTNVPQSNLGYQKECVWIKYTFQNSSNDALTFALYNLRHGVDQFDIHLFKAADHTVLHQGDLRQNSDRFLPKSLYSNFELTLASQEKVQVLIKIKTHGVVEAGWELSPIKKFYHLHTVALMLLTLFGTFMVTLIFKNLVLYAYLKDSILLSYSAFLLALTLLIAASEGVFYYFFGDSDYFLVFFSNLGYFLYPIMSSAFWVFTYLFFYQKGQHVIYRRLLVAVLWINTFLLFFFIFAAFFATKLLVYIPMIIFIGYIEAFALVVLASIMFTKKRPGSQFFFPAHLLYAGFYLAYIVVLDGSVADNFVLHFLPYMFSALSVLFMSIAVSARFKTLKLSSDALKDELIKNEQFITIGSSIFYIFHQWKQPLNTISAAVLHLQSTISRNPDTKAKALHSTVESIENNIMYMNETMKDTRSFFTDKLSHEKISFNLLDLLKEVFMQVEDRLNMKNIELNIKLTDDRVFESNRNLLKNALLNFINNAIEAFPKKQKKKKIMVTLQKSPKGDLILCIKDNAGGMNEEMFAKLFEPFKTTKSDGSGIGLVLSKNILRDYFDAKVTAKNSNEGMEFFINFFDN